LYPECVNSRDNGKGMKRQGLGDWVRARDWTYWETLTHMHDVTPRAGRRAIEAYLTAWRPARAVWVTEYGRVGGRTHSHALTYYARDAPDASDLWHWWHARYGRARIAPHDPSKGATGYILKNMNGAREDHVRRGVDWDIYSGQSLKTEGETIRWSS
jgi:hypothetical protein